MEMSTRAASGRPVTVANLVAVLVLLMAGCASSNSTEEGASQSEGPDSGKTASHENVEELPKLVGGMEALLRRVRYPVTARKGGIEGTVYLRFTVEKDGSTSNLEVLRSPHRLLGKEALRVMRNATFEPGRRAGKAVRVGMTFPLRFALEKSEK